jgi:hypothetical protein
MLSDLKDIVSVVETLIDQPMLPPQQMAMQLPTNIDNLIPYGAIDFANQPGYGTYETGPTGLFRQNWNEPYYGWDSTGNQLQTANSGYGAPWI